ncbi:hypothetical protein [Leisingera sp. JC11]|uniref:hypothetical protein n=1 Tax=Leisingera sp. JC11 TaxID=3042469 RepID=UPI003453A0C9
MEAREDGGARLALNLKHASRSGIQRISCDLPLAGLQQLVIFAEALSLRKRLGHLVETDVSIDGLEMSYDPAQRELQVARQAGYSRQTARMPVEMFLTEMAEMTDICIVRAEASKHGPALKCLLAACAAPAELEGLLREDEADLAMHQLREIAFLLLVQEASARGSALARMLRGKKSQDQAREAVSGLVLDLAAELVPVSA